MKSYTFILSLSVILLLAYAVFLGIKFPSVPEIIPIHYSSEGPYGFGSKTFLWLEAGINAVILILTGLPLFYPNKMFKKVIIIWNLQQTGNKKPTNISVGFIFGCHIVFMRPLFKRDYLGSWKSFFNSTDSRGFILPERISDNSFLLKAAANLSFSTSVSGSISGMGIGLLNSSTATKV